MPEKSILVLTDNQGTVLSAAIFENNSSKPVEEVDEIAFDKFSQSIKEFPHNGVVLKTAEDLKKWLSVNNSNEKV